ncbi:MAG: hypothetical protein JXR41_06305 [Bacteroidales bacterium]|nr:hypothetical protein [Bacteroidales bacterium]MBN2762683.1 hypothetical protein [Bacteroidales bacterium]
MEIKGSAVKSIPEYIKKNHSEKYANWLESLPEESQRIFQDPVLPSSWYPLKDAAIIPTEKLGEMLYGDPLKGAWQCGRHSAEVALTGLYKFFIKAASPFFIISKAGKIFSTYYQPSRMEVADKGDDWVVLQILQFEEPHPVIESRIAGWIEKAMEIHGVSSVNVDIVKSLTRGDKITEIKVSWKYN